LLDLIERVEMLFGIQPVLNPQPWRFQFHPEVWILIIGLVAAFVYAVRVVGPKVVPMGEVISRKQLRIFVAMILLLWLASDWPMHDIAEEYLYSVHMIQHLTLSYVVPALALLATPEWLFRLLVGEKRVYAIIRFMARPVVAAVVYNMVYAVTHIPDLVNRSASLSPLHYLLHVILVSAALLMWMPVCGPAKEMQMKPGGKMIYLFCLSLLPTIPAGWLTVATSPVYKHYDTPVRVWGMNVMSDQQTAGVIMKLGGALFMWILITFIFFKRFMSGFSRQQSYSSASDLPNNIDA